MREAARREPARDGVVDAAAAVSHEQPTLGYGGDAAVGKDAILERLAGRHTGSHLATLSRSRCEASAISSTARSNASSFRREGTRYPLILRTNWRAAARTSSSVACSPGLRSVLMDRHMATSYAARCLPTRRSAALGRADGLGRVRLELDALEQLLELGAGERLASRAARRRCRSSAARCFAIRRFASS